MNHDDKQADHRLDTSIETTATSPKNAICLKDNSPLLTNLTITKAKRYRWNPQEDITTYELAKAIEILLVAQSSYIGIGEYYQNMIESSPDAVRRHFKEV